MASQLRNTSQHASKTTAPAAPTTGAGVGRRILADECDIPFTWIQEAATAVVDGDYTRASDFEACRSAITTVCQITFLGAKIASATNASVHAMGSA
jgi:hypothetical protein